MRRLASSACTVAVVLALAPGAAAAPPPLRVTPSLAPAHIAFGDVVEARLVVDLATGHVDPSSLQVSASFSPFAASGAPSVARSSSGGRTVVAYRYVLSCLSEGCLPKPDGFGFPRATVTARVDGSLRTLRAEWPRLVVAARSSAQDASRATPPFRSDTALPRATTAISPSLLVALCVGGAVLLALAALAALLLALRRPRPAPPALPPLERAIALVRETAREGDEKRRRRALESLAGTLEERGEDVLGTETRTLAWSAVPPAAEPMDALAERVSLEVAP